MHGEKKAKATVVKQPNARDKSVITRVKRTFRSVPKKAPFGMGQLVLKRNKLMEEWHDTVYGNERGREISREIQKIDNIVFQKSL